MQPTSFGIINKQIMNELELKTYISKHLIPPDKDFPYWFFNGDWEKIMEIDLPKAE